MQLISCHDGRLLALDTHSLGAGHQEGLASDRAFVTHLPALDALAPGGAFARGAVHEILSESSHGTSLFLAMLLARRAMGVESGGWKVEGKEDARFLPSTLHSPPSSSSVIWCDPRDELYPPALAAHGIPLERLFLLHPRAAADQTWAVAECLRCRGVAAVVASIDYRLSRVEARRRRGAAAPRGGPLVQRRARGRHPLARPAPAGRAIGAAMERSTHSRSRRTRRTSRHPGAQP